MNRPTIKVLIILLLILDVLLFCAVLSPAERNQEEAAAEAFAAEQTVPASEPETTAEPETQAPQTVPTTQPPEVFDLTFAGDCTFGSSPDAYYADLGFIKTVGDDLEYPFRNVSQYFAEDDFSMVNLEGVLGEEGSRVAKAYNFRGPAVYAKILSQGSIEAVTLANNHTFDYGKKGYESTLAALQAENVPYVERDEIAVVTTQRGLKVGLYGMTYACLDVEDMRAGIRELKEKGAELIIVAPHWGVEGRYEAVDEQVNVGRAAIDAGAHIVFGTHPHVLQPIEEYAGGVIYYSLGNFAFGGNGGPKDMDTAIIRQQVLRSADGTVALGERTLIPASISSTAYYNNFQPTPYPEGSEEYDRVLAKLSGTF